MRSNRDPKKSNFQIGFFEKLAIYGAQSVRPDFAAFQSLYELEKNAEPEEIELKVLTSLTPNKKA